MADVNIVIAAQDMASSVMRNVSASTKTMTSAVASMSGGVVSATKAMSAGFGSLTISLGPLLAAVLTVQAAFAVFGFLRDSVVAFVEAGSPAGQQLAESFAQVGASMNSLMVTIGSVLAPMVQIGSEVIMVMAQALAQSLAPAAGTAQAAMDALRPYIDGFKVGLIAAITGIEVVLTNFGQSWQYVTDSMKLKTVQVALAIGTFFLETAPQAIWDFSLMVIDTIPKIPKIVYDAFVTTFEAIQSTILWLQSKVYEVFTAIWDFIASGGAKNTKSVIDDVTAVASKQLDALGNEMARQTESLAMGRGLATNLLDGLKAEEQRLSDGVTQIADDLGNKFNEKMKERMSALKGPEIAGPAAADEKQKESTEKLSTSLSTVADSQAAIAQQLTASESRLLTRGPTEGPMQTVAQASQKTAIAAEKTQESSDRMVALLEELLARGLIVAEAV